MTAVPLTVGSTFSGVGGFDLGLERAGMKVVFQCEADAYRRRVLNRHWPDVPCYADVCALAGEDAPAPEGVLVVDRVPHVDLLCGGFPCQDLSVAGRRAGLAGARSGLFYEFARLADELVRPGGFVLIENVPGLFSSDSGRDFAIVLASLAELGFHDLAWRRMDSRHFGVAQRRRRVYILARRARGRSCAEILLELDGVQGHPETSWEARARAAAAPRSGPDADRVAATLSRGSSGAGVSVPGRRQEDDENIVAAAVTAKWAKGTGGPAGDECQNLVPDDERSVSERISDGDLTQSLTTRFGNSGADLPDAEGNWLVPDDEPVRGVPYTVHAADSGAEARHAFETDTAKCLDSTGGFASGQGGTVVLEADGVRQGARGEQLGGSRDLAGGADGPDAERDGAGGDERGAGSGADAGSPAADADGNGEASGVSRRLEHPDGSAAPVGHSDGSEPHTFDWQAGGHGDASWRGKSRQWIDDKPGVSRPLSNTKVPAVFLPEQTPEQVGTLQSSPNGYRSDADSAAAGHLVPDAYNVVPVSTDTERDALTATPTDVAESVVARQGSRSDRGTMILPGEGDLDCPEDPLPDGPRYAAMGDAVTVNVIEWLGVRIQHAVNEENSHA